ncbi:hypothetical protein [Streptomyces shenzhenensis]|uniref:hypothetical protein n=1 Tax=Streptomyces shenzhenensis TaxID=943815 RepID=UPI001F33561A|nr:hypothetical protein [Streptomyces shenzhenensis]
MSTEENHTAVNRPEKAVIISSRSTARRTLLTLTTTFAALAPLAVPATAATIHDRADSACTITVDGANAFPESIAADNHHVYTASIDDGTVYRGRLGAKALAPFLPGGQDGRTQAAGIKITGNRLLVAGAFTGRFFVYTSTGKGQPELPRPHPQRGVQRQARQRQRACSWVTTDWSCSIRSGRRCRSSQPPLWPEE